MLSALRARRPPPLRAVLAFRVPTTPVRIPRRGFADIDVRPPKPKASTPLRRAAAASPPSRSNPTPTRSTIQPVFTLTTAERFALPRLRAHLPPGSCILHEAYWVPRWSADADGQVKSKGKAKEREEGETEEGGEKKEGEVFIFGNGSIVCWGLGEREAQVFAERVISRSGAALVPLEEPETEDLEFVTDPSE